MAHLNYSSDELLEAAKGNQSAIWHVTLLWAKQQTGGLDGWASFVGQAFAPTWDEIGDGSALDVARLEGRNFATTADMTVVDVSGDDSRAVLTLTGPDPEWCEQWGTTVEDIDRSNEVLLSAIAERRGLVLSTERNGDALQLTWSRRPDGG